MLAAPAGEPLLLVPELTAAQPPAPNQGSRKRRVGRPRVVAATCDPPPRGHAAGAAPERTTKRARGPKPKYMYNTLEEAADARRERNRKSALESYHK